MRRGLDAYQRRDVRGMSNFTHADCEVFTFTAGVVEAQPFRGHVVWPNVRPAARTAPPHCFASALGPGQQNVSGSSGRVLLVSSLSATCARSSTAAVQAKQPSPGSIVRVS